MRGRFAVYPIPLVGSLTCLRTTFFHRLMADRAATLINKHDVFVKPNEQCRACSDIVMARIGNRRHGALSEVERQNAPLRNEKRTI